MYAGGRRAEMPGELWKPFAKGEAVRIVPFAGPVGLEEEEEEAVSREEVTRGCGLK